MGRRHRVAALRPSGNSKPAEGGGGERPCSGRHLTLRRVCFVEEILLQRGAFVGESYGISADGLTIDPEPANQAARKASSAGSRSPSTNCSIDSSDERTPLQYSCNKYTLDVISRTAVAMMNGIGSL